MDTDDARILEALGRIIARKRKVAGCTQEEVAERLGIGSEAFSRIERGLVSPGIPKLYAMAELFECGIETFFVESSRRPNDQVGYLVQLLQGLSAADRALIIEIVESLSRRLGTKAEKPDSPSRPRRAE